MRTLLQEKAVDIGHQLATSADPELQSLFYRSRFSNEGKSTSSETLREKGGKLLKSEGDLHEFLRENVVSLTPKFREIEAKILKLLQEPGKYSAKNWQNIITDRAISRSLNIFLEMMRGFLDLSGGIIFSGGMLKIFEELPLLQIESLLQAEVFVGFSGDEREASMLSRQFLDPLIDKAQHYSGRATREITERGITPRRKKQKEEMAEKGEDAQKASPFDRAVKEFLVYANHKSQSIIRGPYRQ